MVETFKKEKKTQQ